MRSSAVIIVGAWVSVCAARVHAQALPDAAVPADAAAAPGDAAAPTGVDAPLPVEPAPEPPVHEHKASKHPGKADEEPANGDTPKTKKAKKQKAKKLAFGGRIIARTAIAKTEPVSTWLGTSTVDSARANAAYRTHELRAQLSVEVAGKPRLKNAFIQLRALDGARHKLDVRAGQFKMPFSAIELSSRMELPMADRGLLHTVLVHRLQVAGRAVGATLGLATKASWHPRIDLGLFQGFDDAGNALEVSWSDRLGKDAVARVSVEPAHGIVLGMSGQARVGELNVDAPPIVRRAYAAELDATFELAAGPGTLRAWIEGMIGTSWIVGRAMPCNGPMPCKAAVLEGRAIAAYRVGGRTRRERYVELYALAGAMDPDRDISDDRVVELTGGLTYGAWDLWRAQLELEAWRFGDNAPLGIAEFGATPADTTRVMVQLGARL